MNTDIRNKLTKARTGLILDHCFFGDLAVRLKLVEDETCETMYTDGRVVGYNPAFVELISLAECKGVFAHETLHCALGHCTRRGSRDWKKWNVAADIVVNAICDEAGLPLPHGGVRDPGMAGLTVEQIYRKLPEGAGGGGSGFGCGEVRDAKTDDGQRMTDAEKTMHEEAWKIAATQAAQRAKAQGKLPASLRRLVQELAEPKVDWREMLRRFVSNHAKTDYTWTQPSRRFLHAGLYLPSVHGENMPPIAVVRDTSGSIGSQEIAAFNGEINAIISELPITAISVIDCDASVQQVKHYGQEDLPIADYGAKGGGGTDFRPVFDLISKDEREYCCLIYLTDMCGTFPDEAPEFPVLWASTTKDYPAPWGETVYID